MMDELIEHVAGDLFYRRMSTAHLPRVEKRVATLNAKRRTVVGAITGHQSRHVVVESPTPVAIRSFQAISSLL